MTRPLLRIADAALESYEGVIEAPPGVESFGTTTTIVEAMTLPSSVATRSREQAAARGTASSRAARTVGGTRNRVAHRRHFDSGGRLELGSCVADRDRRLGHHRVDDRPRRSTSLLNRVEWFIDGRSFQPRRTEL
jgi:hypothetical protein